LSASSAWPSAIRPCCRRSSPAISRSRLVLPQPELPNSAVTPRSGRSSSAVSRKCPWRWATSTVSRCGPQACASATGLSCVTSWGPYPRPAGQPLRDDQRRHGDDNGEHAQQGGGGLAARNLDQRIERQRQGARLAGNVGGKGNGGAELRQRPGKGQ